MIKLINDTIDTQDIEKLVEWLKSNPRLTKGDLTVEFEEKWAKKLGTKHAIFVNSGSSAIMLTLAALQFGNRLKNNKIVSPNLSWATDVSSPVILGMDTILVDCNFHDLSVDLNHLEDIFKKERPAAFILVSVLGLIPRMDEIVYLCKQYDVLLLEDTCESMGSKIGEKYLGTYGDVSFFSMYFGHHISTIEGGFICTNDSELYNLMVSMRSHGWDRDLKNDVKTQWRNDHDYNEFTSLYRFYYPGFNFRSTDLQAFIGLNQIDKLDDLSLKRNKNFQIYLDNITRNELTIHTYENEFVSNFAFPVVLENRDDIVKNLINNNIEVRPLIAGAMSNNPFCKTYTRFDNSKLYNSLRIDKFGFYVPNHQGLDTSDIIKICDVINNS